MDGEPLYCPFCGTLPSAIADPRRICPSCDASMKALNVFGTVELAAARRVLEEVQALTSPYGAIPDDLIDAMACIARRTEVSHA